MKQEVIQDFLNLPGIAGIALIDGRSRPYFCGVDQNLNFQQKEALAQGILQVVETIPEGFEAFEFKFTDHQVYIYKLEHGIILLVLTRKDLIYADYLPIVKKLKAALQEDIGNAIATFRLVAGNITLSGLNSSQNSSRSNATSDLTSAISSGSNQSKPRVFSPSTNPGLQANETDPNEVRPQSVSWLKNSEPTADLPPVTRLNQETSQETATLAEYIAAVNQLSKFTTQYLGTAVIVNYWKATRPNAQWLDSFQVERSAQITYSGTQPIHQKLTAQEQQWLRDWVSAFIKRCSQVIRDFPTLITQTALNSQQKMLLLG
jgi:predicted regulator of Ras-like GTPase activity (Roadblock/LC7/MglB family)